jgi:hypothetical protein
MAKQHGNTVNFETTVGFAWHQLMTDLAQKDICLGCASKSILAASIDTLLEHEDEHGILKFIQEELFKHKKTVRTHH